MCLQLCRAPVAFAVHLTCQMLHGQMLIGQMLIGQMLHGQMHFTGHASQAMHHHPYYRVLIQLWPGGNQRFTSVGIGEFFEIFDEQPAKMARPLFPFARIVIA